MAENFYTIVTKTGLAKITNAQLTTETLDLATIVVGDGNGSYYNPPSDASALKKEVWRGTVGSIAVDTDNPNWIVIETVIPATVGGFTVREIGLLDTAGDMIAIGKYPETYKPVLADGSSKDLYIRMIIEVANTSVVTLKVDPTIVIASRKYVDDKIKQSTDGLKDGSLTIPSLGTTNKTVAGAINEVKGKLEDHEKEHMQIVLSSEPPVNPHKNTWWYEDLGKSFDLKGGGEGGLLIGNANLDGSDMIWFDNA